MQPLYPPIEPYALGLLDVGDRYRIYWESRGSPDGKPVVVLHGGPGGGRRFFDPARYRIVLFDQRGRGRGTHRADDPETDRAANTTQHLIRDIELLRLHLVATHPGYTPFARFEDPAFRLTFARLVTHHWANAAWLEDGALLRDAGKLKGIPGLLLHGRLDFSSPSDFAWHLARAWPDAEPRIFAADGHGGELQVSALVEATDRFAERR